MYCVMWEWNHATWFGTKKLMQASSGGSISENSRRRPDGYIPERSDLGCHWSNQTGDMSCCRVNPHVQSLKSLLDEQTTPRTLESLKLWSQQLRLCDLCEPPVFWSCGSRSLQTSLLLGRRSHHEILPTRWEAGCTWNSPDSQFTATKFILIGTAAYLYFIHWSGWYYYCILLYTFSNLV